MFLKLNNTKLEGARCVASLGKDWCYLETKGIRSAVDLSVLENGKCTMLLTGGNAVKKLYRYWYKHGTWERRQITFFYWR